MYNIGVVILNYIAYQDTIHTVDSFLEQDKSDVHLEIVIVDNASPNDSFSHLSEYAKKHENVHICQTEKNLGFAKGNNYGYSYLLEFISPDFVIMSNDDILLPQKGLFEWIANCYKDTNFAVLGPDIYSLRGEFHQSPCYNLTENRISCGWTIIRKNLALIKLYIQKFLHIRVKPYTATWGNNDYHTPSDKVTVHGSFQIFSKLYFKHYSEPYDPATFLYMEENLVKLRCDKADIKMYYSPDYRVDHLQAVATNKISDSNTDKTISRKKNEIASLKVYFKRLGEKKSFK